MASSSPSKLVLSSFIFAAVAIGFANSLRCFQCGLYTSSGSSITPCQNLTQADLKDCPDAEATACTKYDSLAMKVYGCATVCEERRQGLFDIYCCNEDSCNGASSLFGSSGQFAMLLLPLVCATLVSMRVFHPTSPSWLTSDA